MRTIAIVPLRMDSRRLPSKHLRPLDGRPMVDTLLRRLQSLQALDGIVLATTDRDCDDPIAAHAAELGLTCHRGAVDDVLGRCAGAAREAEAELVVKANGDSPLLAPEVIERALELLSLLQVDCVTGKNGYTGLPIGLGAEVLTAEALARLDREVTAPEQREAITAAVFDKSFDYNWAPLVAPVEWRAPELDLCVDTAEDLARLAAILEELPPRQDCAWPVPQILAAAQAAETKAFRQFQPREARA